MTECGCMHAGVRSIRGSVGLKERPALRTPDVQPLPSHQSVRRLLLLLRLLVAGSAVL